MLPSDSNGGEHDVCDEVISVQSIWEDHFLFSCLSHERPDFQVKASVETYEYNKLDEIQGAAQY